MITALQQTAESGGLTVGGIVVMSVSITLVVGLMAWCMRRILREPDPGEHHHAPLEIERPDEQDTP